MGIVCEPQPPPLLIRAMHTYNTGMYSGFPNTYYSGFTHSLGKRDADSDSQMVYTNTFARYPYHNNVYNTAGVYGANIVNAGLAGQTYPYNYGNIWNRSQFIY